MRVRSSYDRVVDVIQWVVGVGTATAVVMLFTLEGAPGAVPTMARGAAIYDQRCATCHGDEGQGGAGPRLAGTVSVLYPDSADEIAVVSAGRRSMPPYSSVLDADEIAAVVAFTREGLG